MRSIRILAVLAIPSMAIAGGCLAAENWVIVGRISKFVNEYVDLASVQRDGDAVRYRARAMYLVPQDFGDGRRLRDAVIEYRALCAQRLVGRATTMNFGDGGRLISIDRPEQPEMLTVVPDALGAASFEAACAQAVTR